MIQSIVFAGTKMDEISDDELLDMAFEALIPLANQDISTDHITPQDIRRAREVLRFLSPRVAKLKKWK
jgi:hypothetical protein